MDQDTESSYQQEQYVIDEFVRRRRNHHIALVASLIILCIGMSTGMLFFDKTHPSTWNIVWIVVSSFVAIGFSIYAMVIWRCPICEKPLGRMGGFSEKFCPYCGEEWL